MITALIVLHVIGCAFVGGSGWLAYYLCGRADDLIPRATTAKQRQDRELKIAAAEKARSRMLPWIILASFAWEMNIVVSLFRKLFALGKEKS